MFIALAWAFKDDEGHKDQSTWRKRLSKAEFLKLPNATRKRYIELYPHSSHRFLMAGKGKDGEENADDFSGHLKNIVNSKKTVVQKVESGRTKPTEEYMQKKAEERRRIAKDISDHNKSNALVINKASLDAVDQIKDDDLKKSSVAIRQNQPVIVDAVKKQAEKQPHMYKRGLGVIKDLLSGQREPEDHSITERHAAERVITGIATMAIMGAGVLAMGVAAAPLGVLAGRLLFDMWSKGSGGKQLREDLQTLERAREKKRKERLKIADEYNDDQEEGKPSQPNVKQPVSDAERKRHEKILARKKEGKSLSDADKEFAKQISLRDAHQKRSKSKSKELAVAGNNLQPQGSEFEEHDDTINLIVEQVADIMQFHTARDFKDSRDHMFSTASASDSTHHQMEYLLTLAHCYGFKPSGDGMYFQGIGMKHVKDIFQGLGYSYQAEADGEKHVHTFKKDDAFVSIGSCDGRYYVRYDGELR
jgi:hypothetical protein